MRQFSQCPTCDYFTLNDGLEYCNRCGKLGIESKLIVIAEEGVKK